MVGGSMPLYGRWPSAFECSEAAGLRTVKGSRPQDGQRRSASGWLRAVGLHVQKVGTFYHKYNVHTATGVAARWGSIAQPTKHPTAEQPTNTPRNLQRNKKLSK
eukprot:363957-Chlamydomonas_euryale.AAC.9